MYRYVDSIQKARFVLFWRIMSIDRVNIDRVVIMQLKFWISLVHQTLLPLMLPYAPLVFANLVSQLGHLSFLLVPDST